MFPKTLSALILFVPLNPAATPAATPVVTPVVTPGAAADESASVDTLLTRLLEQHGKNDKKYASLAKKVGQAVERALDPTPPLFVWAEEHTRAAQAQGKKNSAPARAALERFPWNDVLELILGLDFGSDRPIPKNEGGFIDLAEAPVPFPGYPDLALNHYVFGVQQIVSWRAFVNDKRSSPKYEGRGPKDGPELEDELPPWESLRVLLCGTLPDVPLYVVPALQHALHARLAERRTEQGAEAQRVDEVLALLDSKWNGFVFEAPFSKQRTAFAAPMHDLFAQRKSFVYHFPHAVELERVGDVPFMAIQTQMQYAAAFRGEKLGSGDFISVTPAGKAALDDLYAASAWLARYKNLIELLARSLASPEVPLPGSLSLFDYPSGQPPAERTRAGAFDVPRGHALVLWAWAEKDPQRLADLLHEALFSPEPNRFPARISLPNLLGAVVRERQDELLEAVAARCSADPVADLAREFCPHATPGDPTSEVAAAHLVHSYHAFHAAGSETIRSAARAVVLDELDD